jgi:hypothetical protein
MAKRAMMMSFVVLQDESSNRFRGEMLAGLGNSRVFSTEYCFGLLCAVHSVSGSHLKEHLTFPNDVHYQEWMLLHKHWPLF